MFIYDSKEFNKVIMETKTVDGCTITYTWVARYAVPPYPHQNDWYSENDDKWKNIWMIRREKFDPATWLHDVSYPELDTWFKFSWNNRDNYDYDWWVIIISHVLLENWDTLITENWDYIILW